MRSEQIENGLIFEVEGSGFEQKVPTEKGTITIFGRDAVAIKYGRTSNELVAGGRGYGTTDQAAWKNAVDTIKKQLP